MSEKISRYRGLKPFQKGQSGNPGGRPKLPDALKKIKVFTSEEVERIIAKYMRLSKSNLQKLLKEKSDDLPMFEALICSILGNAYKTGDYSKAEFLLSRTIGKAESKENKTSLGLSFPMSLTIENLRTLAKENNGES